MTRPAYTINTAVLKAARTHHDLSLRQLSAQVKSETGLDIHYAALGNIEIGKRNVGPQLLDALITVLGVTRDELDAKPRK